MDYETTGYLLGVGDQMRRRARDAQAVVNEVARQRDAWMHQSNQNRDIANANLAELNKANAIIAHQNSRIADLEARLRR